MYLCEKIQFHFSLVLEMRQVFFLLYSFVLSHFFCGCILNFFIASLSSSWSLALLLLLLFHDASSFRLLRLFTYVVSVCVFLRINVTFAHVPNSISPYVHKLHMQCIAILLLLFNFFFNFDCCSFDVCLFTIRRIYLDLCKFTVQLLFFVSCHFKIYSSQFVFGVSIAIIKIWHGKNSTQNCHNFCNFDVCKWTLFRKKWVKSGNRKWEKTFSSPSLNRTI